MLLMLALLACPEAPEGKSPPTGVPEVDDTDTGDTARCEGPARYLDVDGDGFGDPTTVSTACNAPGVDNGDDCDDADPTRYPGATEFCDEVDDDCDGEVDEEAADATLFYADLDGDGHGDGGQTTLACGDAPTGYAATPTDCDDDDAAVNHGATELCDLVDNDCDGATDGASAVDATTWYRDGDGDGLGNADDSVVECAAPPGHVADDTDCDDFDATVLGPTVYYADSDRDGFGDPLVTTLACAASESWIADASDCDDTDAAVLPGGTETCDGVDNDCNGSIDESGASGETTWYLDVDGDGYGTRAGRVAACDVPAGYSPNRTDCDDTDAGVSPGATESCNDIDDDCDDEIDESGASGESPWYADTDGDGYGDASAFNIACDAPAGHVADDTDCDDADGGINPGATERCDFGNVDDDCDGLANAADPDLTTTADWYADADKDGAGDASVWTSATCAPDGYVANDTDCDDNDAAVNPLAEESCDDTADKNCDGLVGSTDHDGDGAAACDDCNDADAAESPSATELLDGDDDDCDGLVDEYVGDLALDSEAAVDSFCATYASVEGTLDLDGLGSLRGLGCLRAVSGSLRVSGLTGRDLRGLEQLTRVGDAAMFGGDDAELGWLDASSIQSMEGLERLAFVGGDFWVAHSEVSDLGGAPRLREVGGGVVLYDLPLVNVSLPVETLGVGVWLESLPELASVETPQLVAMGGGYWFERVAWNSGSFTVDGPLEIPGTLGLVELPDGACGGWTLPETVGAVWVSGTELADLSGLEDLREVEGNVVIAGNTRLRDLSALDGLESVGGDLSIWNNTRLPDWDGFASLETIGGTLRLVGTGPTLVSGFSALTRIAEGLSVTEATSLVGIEGFDSLASCGDLELSGAASLAQAPGLAATAFTGNVTVSNTALPDLSFLGATSTLDGTLTVADNDDLLTLDGVDALQSVGGAFVVEDNRTLADASAPALVSVGGAFSLVDLDVLAAIDFGALQSVDGDVALEKLERLPDLGFGALTSVGGLWISQLDSLVDLSGLDALATVGDSVIIEYNDDLASLSGLDSLATVGTDFRLYANPRLASLQGLDGLASVGRDLTLDTNAALVRPDSLGALQSIGRDLWVEYNASLEDFSGMGNFTVGSAVFVFGQPVLSSLDGLDALQEIPHNLVLFDLPSLVDVSALSQLQRVGGDLRVGDCDALVDLSGLSALEEVGESLEIGYQVSWSYGAGNLSMTSLDGLEGLRTVGDELDIVGNRVLADIDALDGLESVGGDLQVSDNVSLLTADANDLADGSPTVGGTVSIYGNL